jgi:hypothetical protein
MRAAREKSSRHSSDSQKHSDWSELLVQAVNTPGIISDAYRRFWNFSFGNQLLAWAQCTHRGIALGPIHTFVGWKDLGRHVRKGEKAITLCMPVTIQRTRDEPSPDEAEDGEQSAGTVTITAGQSGATKIKPACRTVFVYRPHWFVLAQTEGKEYVPAELPEWSETRALDALKIVRIPFRHLDGNAQGYAVDRQVAVSPVAFMPARTLFHELAHVVAGHTAESHRMDDDDSATPRDVREVEAECVALICCSCLGLGGESFSRGYIQHWIKGQAILERSAQKIFRAADCILKAGRPATDTDSSDAAT